MSGGAATIRPLRDEDEIAAGFDVFLRAMVGLATDGAPPPPPTFVDRGRPLDTFVEGRIVGVADSFRAAPTVPGGARLHLVDMVELPGRPLDEPLPLLLADPRAVVTTAVADESWLRLIVVDRALRARGWAETTGGVVIEVTDPLLPAIPTAS